VATPPLLAYLRLTLEQSFAIFRSGQLRCSRYWPPLRKRLELLRLSLVAIAAITVYRAIAGPDAFGRRFASFLYDYSMTERCWLH